MKFKSTAFLLLLSLAVASCSKDDDDDMCVTTDITYTNTIAAIFNSTCAVAGCHVAGNEGVTGFNLEGYASAKAAADFGRIVGAISHSAGFSAMPKNGTMLDQCTIDQISAWVDAGAPE